MTKIKLESNGEVLEVKEPTFGEWTQAVRDIPTPPGLRPGDLMALCIKKSSGYIEDLPASEGVQVYMACKPILDKLFSMLALYQGTSANEQNETNPTIRQH